MKDFVIDKFSNMNTVGKVMIAAGAAVAIVLIPVLVFLDRRGRSWKWRKSVPEEETVEI